MYLILFKTIWLGGLWTTGFGIPPHVSSHASGMVRLHFGTVVTLCHSQSYSRQRQRAHDDNAYIIFTLSVQHVIVLAFAV